jgi:site-specific DNA recombinase
MNIAIYARVSSEKQAKDGTIQSQIEALREYADSHNLTIVQECIDDGFSGADLNRPGLDHLRDLAQEGLIEGALVLSPDRLSRKQAHQIILLEEFQKRSISIIFTNQQFGDTPEDRLMLQIQGSISEYERTKILDRTRRGLKHSVKKGMVLGSNAPYGYRFVPKNNGTLAHWEVDPQEVEIVRRIFDLYVNQRLTGNKIAKQLESDGFPSRSRFNKWWTSTIYLILKNETYTGTAHMYKTASVEPKKSPKLNKYRRRKNSGKADRPREEWIAIPVTPILEWETWEVAQRLLKQNAKQSRRNNCRNDYLLRGLVLCGLCGSSAYGNVSNKKTYYSCAAKRNKNLTTKPHDEKVLVNHSMLDTKIWAGLVELLDDPENIKNQFNRHLERTSALALADHSFSDPNDKEIEKLAIQESRLIDAFREGIITLDELKEQKVKLATKRKLLEANKKTVPGQQDDPGRPEITTEMLGDVSARYHRVMANADFVTREKLVNLLVNSVSLYPNRAVVQGNIPVILGDVLIPANQGSP